MQNIDRAVKYVTNTRAEGRAMAQAVSRRPLTAEARVRSRVSPCGICGDQSGTGTGFPLSNLCYITRKNGKTNHLNHRVTQ
jgi:hypothetical protein